MSGGVEERNAWTEGLEGGDLLLLALAALHLMVTDHGIVHSNFQPLCCHTCKAFTMKFRHFRYFTALWEVVAEKFIGRNGSEIFASHFIRSDNKDMVIFFSS